MRNVVYSVAMSLDAYVAGPNGESDWIVMDPDIDFRSMFARFDTVLMGRRTFDAARSRGHGGSMPGIRSIVVSKTLRAAEHPDVTVVSEDLPAFLSELKSTPGKDIWLFGGGSLFGSLLDLNLVDRVETAIVPILLGGGIPFLPSALRRARLRLLGTRTYEKTGTVSLEYAVDHGSP